MQAMTHFAVGICAGAASYAFTKTYIQEKLNNHPVQQKSLYGFAVATVFFSLAALTHVLLDDIARATYHPPDALLQDGFWIIFHALVLVVSVALLWFYKSYWPFLLASVLPDIDWVARIFSLWPDGSAHALFRSLPLISQISASLQSVMPDWRFVPLAAGIEIMILLSFLVLARLLTKNAELP